MFLTKEQITRLSKQRNVSKAADKTKDRVATDFRAATRDDKKAIIELSGLGESTIFRVYHVGSINARLLVALAQILNVTPFFYTGETDDRAPLELDHIKQFLKANNYDELAAELSKPAQKRPYNRKPKSEADFSANSADATEESADLSTEAPAEETPAEAPADETPVESPEASTPAQTIAETAEPTEPVANRDFHLSFSNTLQMRQAVENLTEQEAIELLRALFIRARGSDEAAMLVEIVKLCVLK